MGGSPSVSQQDNPEVRNAENETIFRLNDDQTPLSKAKRFGTNCKDTVLKKAASSIANKIPKQDNTGWRNGWLIKRCEQDNPGVRHVEGEIIRRMDVREKTWTQDLDDGQTPVLVFCVNASRIAIDIKSALEEVNDHRPVMVVLHCKNPSSLRGDLSDEDYFLDQALRDRVTGIAHFVFSESDGFYSCRQNDDGYRELSDFLTKTVDKTINRPHQLGGVGTRSSLEVEHQAHECTRYHLSKAESTIVTLYKTLEDIQDTLAEELRAHKDTRSRLVAEQQAREDTQRTLIEEQTAHEETRNNLSEAESTITGLREDLEESRNTEHKEESDWILARNEIEMSEKIIGVGGWAIVVEGRFRGSVVAVKQIHELILSPLNRRLFEREMNIASRCRHPCLLQFIGATNDDGNPLFVTELLDTNLRTVLHERALKPNEITPIALDVARALNYLHLNRPQPIIHRDISSANVLLWKHGESWRAKVSDYGTANFMQHAMTVCPGAVVYSAPEAKTSRQSPKVDVYSYGVLLCEMNIRELPDPSGRNQQVARVTSQPLGDLIRRCLNENPEDRPSMEEIILSLGLLRLFNYPSCPLTNAQRMSSH